MDSSPVSDAFNLADHSEWWWVRGYGIRFYVGFQSSRGLLSKHQPLKSQTLLEPIATQRNCLPHISLSAKWATSKSVGVPMKIAIWSIWEVYFLVFRHSQMSQLTFLQPQFREGSSLGRTTCATFIKRRSSTAWSRIPASSTGLEFTLLIRSATFCTTDGPFLFPSTR